VHVRAERALGAVAREVGEHAIGPAVTEVDAAAPRAVGVHRRVQVLEARGVAAHDDEVHLLLVLDLEVAHGLAVAVDDAEGERLRAQAVRERRAVDDQAVAVLRHLQARRRRSRRAAAAAVIVLAAGRVVRLLVTGPGAGLRVTAAGLLLLGAVALVGIGAGRVDGIAGKRGGGEYGDQQNREE
jgi:hypothetical protein